MGESERPIEDLKAADDFRNTLLARADAYRGDAPLWHGWAIFDAFLAGLDHARAIPAKAENREESGREANEGEKCNEIK